jgi:hypothetical protein
MAGTYLRDVHGFQSGSWFSSGEADLETAAVIAESRSHTTWQACMEIQQLISFSIP